MDVMDVMDVMNGCQVDELIASRAAKAQTERKKKQQQNAAKAKAQRTTHNLHSGVGPQIGMKTYSVNG